MCTILGFVYWWGVGGSRGRGALITTSGISSHLLFLAVLSCKIHSINLPILWLPFVSWTAACSLKQRRERTDGGTCITRIYIASKLNTAERSVNNSRSLEKTVCGTQKPCDTHCIYSFGPSEQPYMLFYEALALIGENCLKDFEEHELSHQSHPSKSVYEWPKKH